MSVLTARFPIGLHFAVGSGVRQGCRMARDLFLGPMDYMMEHTLNRQFQAKVLKREIQDLSEIMKPNAVKI